jgi:glycine amidinotransferase
LSTDLDARSHALLTDHEPCFEAASFARCGRDLFWQPDLVSNTFGVEWLRRHLGERFRIHQVEFADRSPLHIDATFVSIRPGLAIVHPDRPFTQGLELFERNDWVITPAPRSVRADRNWAAMNLLMIDEHTAVVEAAETPMIEFVESLGCRVLPCPLDDVLAFGGCIHCCTCDIRRRGHLQSYFPSLDA